MTSRNPACYARELHSQLVATHVATHVATRVATHVTIMCFKECV